MITLRELFQVYIEPTELTITAYHNNHYAHEWIFGDDVYETVHMFQRRKAGKLSIVDIRVNHHGEPTSHGPEMGWGVNEKVIPALILDAEVTHLLPCSRSMSRGQSLIAHIELDPLQVEVINKTLKCRTGEAGF